MPVIAALVDIRTLLEPAFNDYIDTVINAAIYFLFQCVFNLFSTCHKPLAHHSLLAPDSSSHFRSIFVYLTQKEVPASLLLAFLPFGTLLAGSARHLNLTWWIYVAPSCTEVNCQTWPQL